VPVSFSASNLGHFQDDDDRVGLIGRAKLLKVSETSFGLPRLKTIEGMLECRKIGYSLLDDHVIFHCILLLVSEWNADATIELQPLH
jgi:hypothetical protein